jgi:putative DNA primase/helicase
LNGAAYEPVDVPIPPPRPKALALKAEGIPAELRKLKQSVCWKYGERKDRKTGATKYTKIPIRPDGRPADSTNRRTWATFAECAKAYEEGRADGAGFVTAAADPYTLIDLDHVIDRETGSIAPWAHEIIEAATEEGAYIELSPSGTGVHIFGKGPQKFDGRKANDAEMYCRGRFFTLSGWVLPGTETPSIGRIKKTVELVRARLDMRKEQQQPPKKPAPSVAGKRPYAENLTDRQILEQFAFPSANGARLKKLLDGDISDYPSGSEADLACASDLAFWFWLDPVKIESVMRGSPLARDKWDENKNYLAERTIKKALAGKTDYYGKSEERPDMSGTPEPKSKKKKQDGEPPADPKVFDYREHIRPVQDLIDNPPPPIKFLLPGWLARGHSSLLVGRPKNFKSTLAAQMSLALAGNPALMKQWALFGKISKQYRIAIIDYEQSEGKAAELFARFGVKSMPGLLRLDAFPKLDEAGIDELGNLIVAEKLDLVIIDSLTRMAPTPPRGKSVFAAEADLMQGVTNLSHETDAHIMTIAHQGKRDAADDPMLAIAGTNALAASVDDVAVLFKEGDDTSGTIQRKLFVTGRNVSQPGTYVLEMPLGAAGFTLKGSEEAFVRGEMRQRIMGLLGGGATMTPTDLAKSLNRNRGQVHHALASLVDDKFIVAVGKGGYATRTAEAARRFREAAERGKK